MSRICIVGAGYISRVHLDVLRTLPGRQVVAVVDVNRAAAERLAREVGARAFTSVEEALADDAGGFDRAHVLVPPDLHGAAARPLLAAGKAVLLEKPLAVSVAECDALQAAAQAGGAVLGVNQNFVHHPAFARMRRMVEAGRLGRPVWVGCTYNVPLRQLASRQFGHWMFRAPGNILLEQAVHPLSQLMALAGPVRTVSALAGPAVELAPGIPFVQSLDAVFGCARLPAQLRFAVGQDFPFWQVTTVCADGVAVADILADRVFTYGRTRWLPAMDGALSGLRTSGSVAMDSVMGLVRYGLSTAKLRPPSDPFFVSMKASLGAFHAALDAGRKPELDAAFGADLVRTCEMIRDQAFPNAVSAAAPAVAAPAAAAPAAATLAPAAEATPADVAVLGGTGFIGSHVVRRLLGAGLRVRVMARTVANLPAHYADPKVSVLRGDIRDQAAVSRAIAGVPVVVNLAHGGGGADFEAIKAAMVGGAEVVARACLAAGTRRLVHVGSIASLYLGPQQGAVTDATAPDPQKEKRGDYAHAKVLADDMLLRLHATAGLPVVILRPGVVVGEGSSPFHSGLGLFNNEQHCIGWNAGTNPLPFVLAADVADAIHRAMAAPGIEGHAYNIVGDVRLTARDYIAALGQALGRPLRYHPQAARWLWAEDSGKWLVKRATGRQVAAPSVRDFLSRGMTAAFDTSKAKADLHWTPTADRDRFIAEAITIHAAALHAA